MAARVDSLLCIHVDWWMYSFGLKYFYAARSTQIRIRVDGV